MVTFHFWNCMCSMWDSCFETGYKIKIALEVALNPFQNAYQIFISIVDWIGSIAPWYPPPLPCRIFSSPVYSHSTVGAKVVITSCLFPLFIPGRWGQVLEGKAVGSSEFVWGSRGARIWDWENMTFFWSSPISDGFCTILSLTINRRAGWLGKV